MANPYREAINASAEAHPLASGIGGVLGGVLLVAILAAIVERVAFRGMEPDARATATAATAWVIAGVLAGFGFADGGPWIYTPSLWYLPGALIVWAWYRSRYTKAWEDD